MLALLLATSAVAQQPYSPREHYSKAEVMIPMRDDIEIFTQIYEPLDDSRTYPIMLFRTPYGIGYYGHELKRRSLGPSVLFAPSGYIFVYQDVRGKFRSEGEFEVMKPVYSELIGPDEIDETTDTYDTVEWLVDNIPNNNGRVGQWGISYPGWQTVMGMINAHPAMYASSPQASPADMYIGDDFHHNGAFRLMYTFGWLAGNAATRDGASSSAQRASFSYGTQNGYEFFLNLGPVSNVDRKYFQKQVPTWNEYMEHGSYDEYWQRQDVLQHMQNITPAVLNVAGWFDAEDFYGPMSIYYAIEKNDPQNRSTLVVGPWSHGQWSRAQATSLGDIPFDADTATFYRTQVEFPFFEYHLKVAAEAGSVSASAQVLPEALVFETGGNEWKRYDHWPPQNGRERELYLRADGALSFQAPPAAQTAGHDDFISDPSNPVPFSGTPGLRQGHTWMVEDQRFVAGRPDVLVYQTAVLEADIVIAGSIIASLATSTTGSDADWIVKLIDVYPTDTPDPAAATTPDGFQMLVGGEVFRAKFREGFDKPKALEPGKITPIEFDLRDKYHRFKKGHRIMVQIQSTWFPVIDRNPQRFVDIYHAEESDFQSATHTIHRSPKNASHIKLTVLED